jgi:LysM repeat protein
VKTKFVLTLIVLSLLFTMAGTVSASPSGGGFTYVAAKGDTYADLSWKYGVSVDRLLKANGLERNGDSLSGKRFWLAPGQSVVVPIELGGTSSLVNPFLYQVQQGDTLGLLSVRFEIAAWAVAKANKLDGNNLTKALTAGQTLLIPAGPHIHRLAKNETLAQVAALYGVSETYLLKVNSIADKSSLTVGTDITIPVQYDRPFAPMAFGSSVVSGFGGSANIPTAVAQPPNNPTTADAGGPLTFRWIAQNTDFVPVGEGRATATFSAEFKGGQGPFKLYVVNWGQFAETNGPFVKTDNGESWTDLDFQVNAKCGETFALHVEVHSADGQKAFSIREFGPVNCK